MLLIVLLFFLCNFHAVFSSVCPPFSGPAAQFCNVNVRDQLCVNGQLVIGSEIGSLVFGNLSAAPSGQIVASFGNTIRVDQVYGDDATGQKNGLPFLTVGAALAAAQAGDFVWVFPGTYNEDLTIPNGVAVSGVAASNVIIQQLSVVADTDLITMGENSSLENVSLKLTSNQQVNLRGIVFPGTTSVTAHWSNSSLLVDNSGAGAGTSNVYGVHSTGTGLPSIEISAAITTSITVNSTGLGVKRGILVDSASGFNINNVDILVTGGSDSIGVETNNASAAFSATSSNIGGDTADISQTLGSLTVTSTNLIHSQANELGFTTSIAPGNIVWVDQGSILPGSTLFMSPGTATSSTTESFVPASQKFLAKSIAVHSDSAPGGLATWTVFQNGNPTPLLVTLNGAANDNVNSNVSVHFSQGDRLSLQINTDVFANPANISVIVDTY